VGTLSSSLNGTYALDQRQQITSTAPVVDLVNTVGNPPSLRLVGNLAWSLKGWTVQGTVNYTGAYRDPASVPERRVDSWTTVDINIGYRPLAARAGSPIPKPILELSMFSTSARPSSTGLT